MIITPKFSINQDDSYVNIKAYLKQSKIKESEVLIEDNSFCFYSKPQLLRLTFESDECLVDEESTVKYDFEDNSYLFKCKKMEPKEFANLGLIGLLLNRHKESQNSCYNIIEEIDAEDDYKDENNLDKKSTELTEKLDDLNLNQTDLSKQTENVINHIGFLLLDNQSIITDHLEDFSQIFRGKVEEIKNKSQNEILDQKLMNEWEEFDPDWYYSDEIESNESNYFQNLHKSQDEVFTRFKPQFFNIQGIHFEFDQSLLKNRDQNNIQQIMQENTNFDENSKKFILESKEISSLKSIKSKLKRYHLNLDEITLSKMQQVLLDIVICTQISIMTMNSEDNCENATNINLLSTTLSYNYIDYQSIKQLCISLFRRYLTQNLIRNTNQFKLIICSFCLEFKNFGMIFILKLLLIVKELFEKDESRWIINSIWVNDLVEFTQIPKMFDQDIFEKVISDILKEIFNFKKSDLQLHLDEFEKDI